MFRFQYNEYLLALVAIPVMAVLYFVVLHWKRRTIKKIGDERLVKEMTKNYSAQRFTLKFLLIVFAFATGVLALANLRSPNGTEKVSRNGIDVMIALDVSKSMLAQDIQPSRLERAKQVLGKLIDKLSNDRVGIVVFAGRAYLQMPLTGDHGAAKMYLSSASTDVVPTQGTVLADALQMCYSSFNAKEKKYKAVVLISDGEDHDEGALTMAGQMANEGIMINTIGIGSPGGSQIVDPATNEVKKDNQGNVVITKLNEEELQKIAAKGNGIYQLFSNTDEVVSKLDAQLSSMDQRTVTEDALVNYRNYFPYFLAFTLLLLVIELLISTKIIHPKGPVTVAKRGVFQITALLFFMIISPAIFAQNDKSIIKKGNDAYSKKDFDKAIESYKKVTGKDPSNATAQYNLGNALYRNKMTDDAIAAYDNAVNNLNAPEDKSRSYYNKGVVLQNNKKLPECIAAYKTALKLNPGDDDARQNLQKALQQQKQQQQQQKDKKNQDQKKNKEDDKQKEKQKPKDEDKNDQPKPQPSKLTKQDAEEKLKALLEQEKNLQDKLKKINTATLNKPEKDW
jgi:Ca-activated chloride channel family protein